MIDDISIEYEGNRLVKADDSVDGPYGEGLFHFVDGADEEYEYSYDENGNMTKDLNRGIEEIRYNFLNLPSKITFTEKNAYIRNMYDANGHKFKMITYASMPLVIGRAAPAKVSARAKAVLPEHVTDSLLRDNSIMERLTPIYELIGVPGMTTYNYCGNIVYRNGIPTIYREDGFTTLARMRFPEFHYYIRDHQGNIRGVTDGRGNIEQQNDYYPFGGMMASSTGGAVQPYRYTGKELVRFQGLDWLDYGARWYDPAILRWNGVDKLAEKNNSVSAYTFCHNNPVNRVDPDGKDDYFSTSGQYIKTVGTGADIYIGKTNFRDLNLMSDRNMKVAARVIGHYARQVGIKYNMNGGTGKVGLGNLHPSSAILAATLPNGDIYINRVNGKLNSEMYNLYNLKSTLRHEGEHKSDFESKKTIKNKSVRHAEIILNEIAHPDFAKGTESFQEGIIGDLTYYVNKSNRNISAFEGLVKKSNQVLYKVGYKLEIYRNHVYYERK